MSRQQASSPAAPPSNMTPENLRLMASCRSGRRILKRQRAELASKREEYARLAAAHLAGFDEGLRLIDEALNPGEIAA